MLRALLAFPILGILLVIQSAIVSRLPLLHGTADLILLALVAWALQERVTTAWIWTIVGGIMISFMSAVPAWTPLIAYLLVTGFARFLQSRIWKTPILAMFATTFVGTLTFHGLTIIMLQINGVNYPLMEALNLITLPSMLLNLLLAVPMYVIFKDLADWLYPAETEV